MTTIETIQREHTYTHATEYASGQAGVVRSGQRAKTSFLVGCFVPVIRYNDEILIGHFGWKQTTEARVQLSKYTSAFVRPLNVNIYCIDTETSHVWWEHESYYGDYLDHMKEVVAKTTHTKKGDIMTRTYADNSVVVVDWSNREENPKIFWEKSYDNK